MSTQIGGQTNQYEATDFRISCRGLKSRTTHRLFYGDLVDVSGLCRPDGGNVGDPLITDASGSINFWFLFDGQPSSISQTIELIQVSNYIRTRSQPAITDQASFLNALTSPPTWTLTLRNDLGDSFCRGTVSVNMVYAESYHGGTYIQEGAPITFPSPNYVDVQQNTGTIPPHLASALIGRTR
jgi:hypothetical protein